MNRILRQEGGGDVFALRRWPSAQDEDWDMAPEDDDENDDDDDEEPAEDRRLDLIFNATVGQVLRTRNSTMRNDQNT